MKIEWKEFKGRDHFVNEFLVKPKKIDYPVGLLVKYGNGVIWMCGHFDDDGTRHSEEEINWPDITHYSTSLVDHLQKEIPELYKK